MSKSRNVDMYLSQDKGRGAEEELRPLSKRSKKRGEARNFYEDEGLNLKNESDKFEPIIIHDWKNDFKGSPARRGKKLAIKHDVVGIKPINPGSQ